MLFFQVLFKIPEKAVKRKGVIVAACVQEMIPPGGIPVIIPHKAAEIPGHKSVKKGQIRSPIGLIFRGADPIFNAK